MHLSMNFPGGAGGGCCGGKCWVCAVLGGEYAGNTLLNSSPPPGFAHFLDFKCPAGVGGTPIYGIFAPTFENFNFYQNLLFFIKTNLDWINYLRSDFSLEIYWHLYEIMPNMMLYSIKLSNSHPYGSGLRSISPPLYAGICTHLRFLKYPHPRGLRSFAAGAKRRKPGTSRQKSF